MRSKTALITAVVATIATTIAQAKNTPDDWKWASEYYATYGEWTVACEHRADDEAKKRCYLRYVDVYANDPFGAFFVFATRDQNIGLRFNFEYEANIHFREDWSVDIAQAQIWQFDPGQCPSGSECPVLGASADELAKALGDENASLQFSFTDSAQREFNLAWPAAGFAQALKDLGIQSRKRGL